MSGTTENHEMPVQTERSGWDPYALPAGTPRQQIIAGLRILATWLEDHPDAPTPDAVHAQYSAPDLPRAEALALIEQYAEDLDLDTRVGDHGASAARVFGTYPTRIEYVAYVALPPATTAEVVSAALEA